MADYSPPENDEDRALIIENSPLTQAFLSPSENMEEWADRIREVMEAQKEVDEKRLEGATIALEVWASFYNVFPKDVLPMVVANTTRLLILIGAELEENQRRLIEVIVLKLTEIGIFGSVLDVYNKREVIGDWVVACLKTGWLLKKFMEEKPEDKPPKGGESSVFDDFLRSLS
ncbi:MAG: hypothetical protein ABIK90_03510 [candidate division WOR-3 bacterium]